MGEMALSAYYLATEIKAHYAGMLIAVMAVAWERYDAMTVQQLARELLQLASRVDPVKLRKHPRGPKAPKKKVYVSGKEARRHVSNARVLQEGHII